jgi:phospholipase/lecithinase/hemolysin
MSTDAPRAKLRLFAILLAVVALTPSWALSNDDDRRGFRRPFDRIVVFGTSLSDPGNGHLVAEWPYAAGGGRFSNGPTWVEQLARPMGLSASAKAAYDPRNRGASNFALGGATARGTGERTLSDQLERFFTAAPRTSGDTLFVIEIGGNDVRDALAAQSPGGVQAAVQNILAPALTSVAETIFVLWRDAGATNFLVWNVPNLGRAPAIARTDAFLREVDPTYSPGSIIAGATALSSIYNNGIPGTPFTDLPGSERALERAARNSYRDVRRLRDA